MDKETLCDTIKRLTWIEESLEKVYSTVSCMKWRMDDLVVDVRNVREDLEKEG